MPEQQRGQIVIILDDRALLFALDRLYREAIQTFERATLLPAARTVSAALAIDPLDVPPEGYYSIDGRLTEYFRLMRALQAAPESQEPVVASLPEFKKLRDVCTSPIYGRPDRTRTLLPTARDALGQALDEVAPDWTMARLLPAARSAALKADDYSLVWLAAQIEDPVVLTAVRESVVLYVSLKLSGLLKLIVDWKVTTELAAQANRFVEAFNALVPTQLPAVVPENGELFFDPGRPSPDVAGRCVRIGVDPLSRPMRHYHWAICWAGRDVLKARSSGATSCGRRSAFGPSARGTASASRLEGRDGPAVGACHQRQDSSGA
jgi:hypothetical protein